MRVMGYFLSLEDVCNIACLKAVLAETSQKYLRPILPFLGLIR